MALHFKKRPSLVFLKMSANRVLCALGHIFNKVKSGIVQKPDTFGVENWPGRKLLLRQMSDYFIMYIF